MLYFTLDSTTLQPFYGSLDFVQDKPGEPVPEKNIHLLTSVVVINHPVTASSIFYDPRHPPCSIYVPDSLFPQSPSKFSLVNLLAWHPPLHTTNISSPNHCLLFAAHAHTITTCFAVVPKSPHQILVSLPTLCLRERLTLSCSLMPQIQLTILISAC